jgi:hypothetical protein
MTLTLDLPKETEQKLLARAAATGKDVATLVTEAVEEKLRAAVPTFTEILAPVQRRFPSERHDAGGAGSPPGTDACRSP